MSAILSERYAEKYSGKLARKPLVFILFGATGDLARRKILPGLASLYNSGKLPNDFAVLAFSRRPWKDKEYRDFITPTLKAIAPSENLDSFLKAIMYVEGTFDDGGSFENLAKKIRGLEKQWGTAARKLCHFAVEPEFYSIVARSLAKAGLQELEIMVEKPFGFDLASAKEFDTELSSVFEEKNILHVDHYLVKKGIVALLEARQTEGGFEAKLNTTHVKTINIFLCESHSIEERGKFYDKVGVVRDVGQNHMMQMFAAAAMDIPAKIIPLSLRQARAEILSKLKLAPKPNAVRAQYKGFREEKEVDRDSETETFFSIDAVADTPRWRGTTFHFESGKNLAEERKEIEIIFRDGSKKAFALEKTAHGHAEAYQALIEKALAHSLEYFVSIDEIFAEWTFADQILAKLKTVPLAFYTKGDFIRRSV